MQYRNEYRNEISEIDRYCGFYKLLNLKLEELPIPCLINKEIRPKGRKTTARPKSRETMDRPGRRKTIDKRDIGYPGPHVIHFTDLLKEENRHMRNEGYAASAPTPNDEELQKLVEEDLNSSISAQAPPVAAQRTMSPLPVHKKMDKEETVQEPVAQNAVVVGMKPPHPRNWLESM